LAIIVIDGISDPGIHLSTMSNEFIEHNIVWVIVGVRTPPFTTWDLYHRFAGNTGRNKSFINILSNYL
jgi:hypothetical protein